MPIRDLPISASVLDVDSASYGQRVGGLTALPALLREFGIDPASALLAAGLNPTSLDAGDGTIPYSAFGRLLDQCARQTGCAHLGLRAGQYWSLSTMGLVGELMRHSPSVREGLRLALVYHHLNSQGGVAFLRERAGIAELGYAIYYQGIQGADQIYDGVLAAITNYMRELCGPAWKPDELLVAHAPPADVSPYQHMFRSPVRFNSEMNTLRFSSRWLDKPVAGADPQRLRALEKQASTIAQPDLIHQLHRSLRVLLLSGVTSGDAIADMLAMHRRTLNRRLKSCGTTFRAVLDNVRFEAACQLLAGTQLALEDIAAALGYAGVSPFTRAFRRRWGTAPGQWRQAAKARDASTIDAPGEFA